nr:reverse transcriptase domain-containing protein [Tanacetum cinerariifolium]
MGESSHVSTLEQHGKQIEEILNHLDELPLGRIERIEDDVGGLGKGRVIIQQDYDQMRVEFQKSRSQYCPRTEIKKMEDEFYNLSVKGNDLKTYVRRFQELAILCPNMVPNNEKLIEVFIGGLPRSIEGNVTASKPQTLEEAINIAQRRFQELAILCPNMVPNNEKLIEVFIGGLPRSIEGNVTASKPQTLEEAINIAQ